MKAKTTEELITEMLEKPVPDPVTGMVYFDGGAAWKEFSQRLADETGPGKLIDDFDDAEPSIFQAAASVTSMEEAQPHPDVSLKQSISELMAESMREVDENLARGEAVLMAAMPGNRSASRWVMLSGLW